MFSKTKTKVTSRSLGSLKGDSGRDVIMSSGAKSIIEQHTINWSNCHHHILWAEHNTVFASSSILRQPNFVITCFRIQFFLDVIFPIYYDNPMNHHAVRCQIYVNANDEIYKLGIWPQRCLWNCLIRLRKCDRSQCLEGLDPEASGDKLWLSQNW